MHQLHPSVRLKMLKNDSKTTLPSYRLQREELKEHSGQYHLKGYYLSARSQSMDHSHEKAMEMDKVWPA